MVVIRTKGERTGFPAFLLPASLNLSPLETRLKSGSILLLPLFVSILVLPLRLIDSPRVIGGFEVGSATLREFGCVVLHPTLDRRMIDAEPSFEHHLAQDLDSSEHTEDTSARTGGGCQTGSDAT